MNNAALESAGGKYYALVIGINDYRYLEKLKIAVDDVREIARVLSNYYGFEAEIILDSKASRDNIMRELNNLRKKLTAQDRLLIYYAGHGDYNKETDASYWLPVDAEKDDNTNWIEAKNITDQLKLISSRHILLVADSCYSGTLTRKAKADLYGNETRDAYIKKILMKPARVLITSGGNEPVSDAGGKGHSIFANIFINALKNPGRRIFTAEELHTNFIKESVAGRSEQTPEYKAIRNSGHDGGDFIFIKIK